MALQYHSWRTDSQIIGLLLLFYCIRYLFDTWLTTARVDHVLFVRCSPHNTDNTKVEVSLAVSLVASALDPTAALPGRTLGFVRSQFVELPLRCILVLAL